MIQDIIVHRRGLTIDPQAKREILKPMIQYHSTFLDFRMFIVKVNIYFREGSREEKGEPIRRRDWQEGNLVPQGMKGEQL